MVCDSVGVFTPLLCLLLLQEVKALLDKGVYDMQELADGGWVTALKYEDEIIGDLKKKTGGKDDEVSWKAGRSGCIRYDANYDSVIPGRLAEVCWSVKCRRLFW